MKEKNKCSTYFVITGPNFNPDEITSRLEIEPNETWKASDLRRDGKPYGFSFWQCGSCHKYCVYTHIQMEETIAKLLNKIEVLNTIRDEFGVEFKLVIVPKITAGGINPCLSPSMEVIDFCHATRTKIDIDMYVYSEND